MFKPETKWPPEAPVAAQHSKSQAIFCHLRVSPILLECSCRLYRKQTIRLHMNQRRHLPSDYEASGTLSEARVAVRSACDAQRETPPRRRRSL